MASKAKERRGLLDEALAARATIASAPRPALPPRQLGPIAEQANIYAEHVANKAKLFDEAKAQGRLLLELDPKEIRPTEFQNRHGKSLLVEDPEFQKLVESLKAHGQEIPIRVRPAANALPFKFEIISGHRRHAACVLLNQELDSGFRILAIVDGAAAETRDLVLKMYRENEERYDLSPFEKGRMFQRWLDAGIYPSQRELSAAVGLHESMVARYLNVAGLPAPVLAAFRDERQIPMSWAAPLQQALKLNAAAVIKAADRIAQRQPPVAPDAVLKALVAAAAEKKASRGTSREESVRIGGRIPLKVGSGRNRIVLKLAHVDEPTQKQLREEFKDWAEAWLRKKLETQ